MVDCLSTDRNSIFRSPAISMCSLYWLAGILEGEGSFLKGPPSSPNSPCVCLNMCDKDVVSKVAFFFGSAITMPRIRKANWKQSYSTRIRGYTAVQWMTILRPLMPIRRKSQIDAAIEIFKSSKNGWAKLTIEEIERSRKRIKNGESMRSIARSLNVSHSTLNKRLHGTPSFYVDFLQSQENTWESPSVLRDPFLVAQHGYESFYIDVWEEPEFERKHLI